MIPLHSVVLASEVHMLCSAYALCTENEEVALLLLGDYTPMPNGANIAIVQNCFFVVRKDKRKDRVEISSQELSRALLEADQRSLKVIGWCHSHPKITILPSHVDLATQLTMQTMDSRFFGLIYSCFHTNQDLTQRIQVTAFQSISDESGSIDGIQQIKIPLTIPPLENGLMSVDRMSKLAEIPSRLYDETCLAAEHTSHLGQTSENSSLQCTEPLPAETTLESLSISRRVCLLLDKFIVPALQCLD